MISLSALRDMPIGRKLFALSAGITALLLAAFAGVGMVKEVSDWGQRASVQLETSGHIIAANAAPALLFGDSRAATETLAGLSSTPHVVYGAIYDQQGALFAVYGDAKSAAAHLAGPPPAAARLQRSGTHALRVEPIVFQGQRLGVLYQEMDLAELYQKLLNDLVVMVVVALMGFITYALVVGRVQRGIVRPIGDLTTTMERVSRTSDYSLRAMPATRDEIGVLAQSFNAMLAVVQDRDTKLAQHQQVLEETVRQRTAELQQTNVKLEKELTDRRIAQEELHAHDAMLKAVTRSAGELLGSLNLDDAIARVLELIGQTLAVGRVQLTQITVGRDAHLFSSVVQEWCAPGVERLRDHPLLNGADLTLALPRLASAAIVGDRTVLGMDDLTPPLRALMEPSHTTSALFVPIMIEGRLWGGMWFVDSNPTMRNWTWAETDTLETLAGLMGVSTARARYLQELADANTIVQNSPTVLYRLKGDPQLQLTYISHNVTKFGYDPKTLVAANNFLQQIVHPDDQAKLNEAMAGLMERNASGATVEFRLILPSGGFRWVENRYTLVRDEVGRLVEIEGIIIDITERKAAEEKIALLARTDSLTGLANRATFVERLHQAFAAAKRGAHPFAVLYLDLDHFKDINDTRGHPVGDKLLRETAERLKSRVRETDVVARLGGDEFAVLQTEVADAADAGALGEAIVDALGQPYLIDGAELHVTASVGISPFAPNTTSPDVMLSQADLALYRAKEDGRNQYRFHSDDLDEQVSERVAISTDLRKAIRKGQLYLDYQPQVELLTGKIVGMEALVRWKHPNRGLLKPGDFLRIAESSGVMDELGRWVLENACAQMAAWKKAGLAPPVMAVNVAMHQLKNGGEFFSLVKDTLERHGMAPGELELDVTESMLAKVTLAQNDILDRLADAGVRLALDDFGAEYSTFDYLRAYRVNHLKVAREFIENATHDTGQAATVRAIIGAARELGIKVIAEGVENDEQRSLLLSIGRSTKAQGFYFSEPVDPARAAELLKQGAIALPLEAEAKAPEVG
ncbi:bifunctional diguanylate cyclase/phosphodiesterase [Phenylobacterium soli]|nr:EAL domain-containing protein [Phenylobacterium soli]